MGIDMIPLFVMGYEWIWLVLIAGIVIFGAKKIPEIARALGKSQGEFEKGKIQGIKEAKELANSDERVKLVKAAESLGIQHEGLNDEQLKEAINKSLTKPEK
jgi:sec-independent protein translocase protein TatA